MQIPLIICIFLVFFPSLAFHQRAFFFHRPRTSYTTAVAQALHNRRSMIYTANIVRPTIHYLPFRKVQPCVSGLPDLDCCRDSGHAPRENRHWISSRSCSSHSKMLCPLSNNIRPWTKTILQLIFPTTSSCYQGLAINPLANLIVLDLSRIL